MDTGLVVPFLRDHVALCLSLTLDATMVLVHVGGGGSDTNIKQVTGGGPLLLKLGLLQTSKLLREHIQIIIN